ncbi:hypothetical protein ACWGCP_39015, partial [Streptomyces niveus]
TCFTEEVVAERTGLGGTRYAIPQAGDGRPPRGSSRPTSRIPSPDRLRLVGAAVRRRLRPGPPAAVATTDVTLRRLADRPARPSP